MDKSDNTGDHRNNPENPIPAVTTPYNGKVMVVSVIICFTVLLIIAFFHLYTRLYWGRRRRQSALLRRNRRQSWSHDQTSTAATARTTGKGLPPAIMKALPTFQYSVSYTAGEAMECAVCLSEFEDGETGRVLPDCKHWFHVECIDMWFGNHSNCPLCRAPVEPISDGLIALPTVWSPYKRDRKLPELTGIIIVAPGAGVKQNCPGCSSGSSGPTVDPK